MCENLVVEKYSSATRGQASRQADRQAGRQTDRQAGRYNNTYGGYDERGVKL